VAVAAPPPATFTAGGTTAAPFGFAVRTTATLLPGVPEGGYANSFPYGQCAYWAALNHRVTWSGADWLASAAAQGVATAQIPTVGAIAVWPPGNGYGPDGHVAVVTAVAPSSYTVSEMNYLGEGVVDARTIPWPDSRVAGFIP
jgi:surface antigen